MKNTKYFSACNSRYGFLSYFDKIFNKSDFENRFIIKGGPGTGKSTFMKEIVKRANKIGYDTELYYCSSDVKSIDGVIIPKLKTCIIDGTAPHSMDAAYPGCVDKILDMSAFRDDGILTLYRNEITELFDKSEEYYKKGYAILSPVGNVMDILEKYAYDNSDIEKIKKTCEKYVKRFGNGDNTRKEVLLSSISADGIYTIPDAFSSAENNYFIDDSFMISHIFTDVLSQMSNAVLVKNPLNPQKYEAVYFENSKTLFTYNVNLISGQFKTVYTRRFAKDTVKDSANSVRLQAKLAKSLFEDAVKFFQKAKDAHNELEKIYSSTMDFEAKEEWTEDFLCALFE